MATQEKHLYYLSELKDYKVDKHDHDIRGWKVKDRDYRTVGKVDNLLVNIEIQKVVYVDVEVDQSILDRNYDPYAVSTEKDLKEFINKDGENHVIIPIGLVEINEKEKYIYTASIDHQTFSETKRYRSGTEISRNYEHHVLGSYARGENQEPENLTDNLGPKTSAREREHIRPSEDCRKPIDDHNRVFDHMEKHQGLHPEKSIDEDQNWAHEDRNLEDISDPHRNYNSKKSDFYNRREFKSRQ